jgi:hypothetical protein
VVKVRFELLALFRHKAGSGEIEVEVVAGAASTVATTDTAGSARYDLRTPGTFASGPTALEALRCLEARLAPRALGVVEGHGLRRGVLLFVRRPGLPMERIAEPSRRPLREGETLVLATAMEGG